MNEQGYLTSHARTQSAPADSHHRRQGGEQPGDPDRRAQQLQRRDPHAALRAGAGKRGGNHPRSDAKRTSSAITKITRRNSPNPNSARSAFSPSRPRRSKTRSTITEADLKAAYEANKDKLGNPEKRHVQQIPFPDLAAANAAYQKIQSGTDFAALAKEQELERKRHRSRHRRAAPSSPIPRSPTPPSSST